MNTIFIQKIEDGKYLLTPSNDLELSEIYFDGKSPKMKDFLYFIENYPKTIQKRKNDDFEGHYVLLDEMKSEFLLPNTISLHDMAKVGDIVPDLKYCYDWHFTNLEDIEVLVVELISYDCGYAILGNLEHFPIKGE